MSTTQRNDVPRHTEPTLSKRVSRRTLLRHAAVAGAAVPAAFSARTALAGFGSQAGAPRTQVSQDTVKIRFQSRGGEYIKGVVDEQIAAFKEVHPEIEVQQDMAAGDYIQKHQLETAAGNTPDAWFGAYRATGLFWHSGLAENLEPYLSQEPTFKEDDYIDVAWIAQTYDGDRWGLPWDSGAMAIIYNIDILNEAGVPLPDPVTPMTWDELLDMATKLTLDLDDRTPADEGFDPSRIKRYGFEPDLSAGFPQWLHSNNAEIIAPDESGANPLTCPIDTPEAIEAFQFVADLSAKHYVAPNPSFLQSAEMTLHSSTVAMGHDGVWQLGRLNDAGINWGIAPFPVKQTPVSYGHYSPLAMSARGEHKQETFAWVYWSTCSHDGEKILSDRGMQQPIRKDLRDEFINSTNPPATEYRQAFYDAFNPETFRWAGDTIGSFWNGWCQPKIDMWGATLDPLWSGEVQYQDMAADFRAKNEKVLTTGEVK